MPVQLAGAPPLFFRQVVVAKLEEATKEPAGFDVGKPFSADVNQAAAPCLPTGKASTGSDFGELSRAVPPS